MVLWSYGFEQGLFLDCFLNGVHITNHQLEVCLKRNSRNYFHCAIGCAKVSQHQSIYASLCHTCLFAGVYISVVSLLLPVFCHQSSVTSFLLPVFCYQSSVVSHLSPVFCHQVCSTHRCCFLFFHCDLQTWGDSNS